MKIAILNAYQNVVSRGAETYIRELSKVLRRKHEVGVFSGNKQPAKRWPFLWRTFLDPQGISIAIFTIKILGEIWRGKYDIVIPTNGGWQSAFIRLLTWLQRTKMIIPGFSGIGWDDRNNLWCFPDRFVAMSPKACKWAKTTQPLVRSVYIPGGVDINKFSPEGDVFKTRLKRPIILCVSAYTKDKRIDLIIEAVSKVKNTSLILAGKGDLENELKKMGTKKLGNRFKMVHTNYNKLPHLYRAIDIHTSVAVPHSAFELVIIEAMACGKPVVVTDDEVRRNIIGDAGILVDPTNIDFYAKALTKALETDWGNKPRKQAEKFSWDKVVGEYENLFEGLVHGENRL